MNIKIFCFVFLIFSGFFPAQKYNHTDNEDIIVDNMVTSRKYGIKDADGNWVLKPAYNFIEDFYDDELNLIDTITVFHNSQYYKNSNIFLGNKCGLINNKGKILIPDIYDKLICQKGTCAASIDKKTFIIDYHNNRKQEVFEGQAKYYRDSLLILEKKQNNYYVQNLKSGKLDGPFYEAKILKQKNIYFTGNTFHRLNGDLLLTSDEIYYQYEDNFFADDVYISYKNPRKFFRNLSGKTFQNFDNITHENGEIFSICPQTISGGDYTHCPTQIQLTIFDILKGLGEIDGLNNNYNFSNDINFSESKYDSENIPPINIIKKGNKYAFANSKGEILSRLLYTILKPSFAQNEDTFYFEKAVNGKNQSGIIENGIEILKTDLKTIAFYGNTLLVFDKEKLHYKIISKEKEIVIKEKLVDPSLEGLPIESELYTLKTKDKYFTVSSKGKLKETTFLRLSNFYKNHAFAMQKNGEIVIVNEKLKIIKNLDNKSYRRDNAEIDSNGNAVFENKENRENQFLINYKGEVIIDKNNAEIERTNDFLYRITDRTYNRGGDIFVDKNGKLLYDYGETLNNSRIFRKKNYFYIRVYSRNYDRDFYFFDNSGKFLGKDLPLYKQSLKEY